MTLLINHTLGYILDHYSDVIEGGKTHRGSSETYSMPGIPGLYSNDLALSSDSPITVSSAEGVTFSCAAKFRKDRWISSNSAPYFAVDSTGEHRKITNFRESDSQFTIASAFTTDPNEGDSIAIRHGFKRIPNHSDIEEDAPEGFDRCFHLSMDHGIASQWWGAGNQTYLATLTLRLRLLKFARAHDYTDSALANMCILRTALTLRQHLEPTYTRALFVTDGEMDVKEDKNKLVIFDKFKLLYRVSSDFDAVAF